MSPLGICLHRAHLSWIPGLIVATLLAPANSSAQTANEWKQRIATASAGQTIELPEGEMAIGDISVPAGVIVRGAGYRKTVINAAGFRHGLVLKDVNGGQLSDLAIRGASECGVLARNANQVTLARLMLTENLTGVLLDNVGQSRCENLVIAGNRTGAIVSGAIDTAVVNCSLIDNRAIALSVSGSQRVAIFNNLLMGSPTAVIVGRDQTNLVLDHNLYRASFIGKLEGEATRATLPSWQRISGHDAHSLAATVDFADPAKHDYRPTSVQSWAPVRATTSDSGTNELSGFTAPKSDIDGRERVGAVDLGAYEVSFPAPRPPDGQFEVTSDQGVVSAGLFDTAGVNVVTFFQNQPLPRGKHDFWLPGRDNANRPIPPGNYEVRVVESQLTNPYLGLAGNFGRSSERLDNCSWAEEMFAFDAKDRLYIAQNSFENGMGVRAFDATYTTPRWMMPGGGGTVGTATDDTWIYYLQKAPGDPKSPSKYNLRKINLETGEMGQIAPGAANRFFSDVFSSHVYGLTHLNGRLYVADSEKGKVFHTSVTDPTFTESFDVPEARSVTADAKTGLLWVISSGGALLALDPATGVQKAKATPVEGARAIAANNGRLAVLSTLTGKIHLLDSADPAKLTSVRTIGTGDGPFGPIQADRFWFQKGKSTAEEKLHVAINSRGDVAVVDGFRVSFWSADGTLKKQGMGFWGQHNIIGKLAGDDDVRVWSITGDYSIRFDSRNKRWLPDTRWELPAYRFQPRSPRCFFSTGGKNFAVHGIDLGDPAKAPDGKPRLNDFKPEERITAIVVLRLDARQAVPVSLYYPDSLKKALIESHDTTGDGMIDEHDQSTELRLADGNPATIPGDRYGGHPMPNGDLLFTNAGASTTGTRIRMTGLDPTGNYPVYLWNQPEAIPCRGETDAKFVSPFDYKTQEDANRTVQIAPLSDGGYASSISLKTSGGTGLANGAGTDIAGFARDGRMRWLFKLNNLQGSEGVQSIPEHKLVLGMTSTHCDYMVMDEDGLGLGVLSMPRESHWSGMWSDHAQQQQAWVGNDGQPYYLLGDYSVNGFHWFSIQGVEKTRRQKVSVTVDNVRAELFAKSPERAPDKPAALATSTVLVRRLQSPLVIDGNLAKWSTIPPAAIVTPDTGTADIKGAQDCSAIIRLAYHQKDLYVQTIVFDDRVTFHQPQASMFQQDGIEMAINSFMSGFKYNVAITSDQGPTVFRNKFVVPMDRIYTADEVPRLIKVLDSAETIEDRGLIEAIYGVDLRKSRVIVTEFKLPLTAEIALAGEPQQIKEISPGKSFWIGFMINDNDIPGGDVQKFLTWPATYGTFNVKEAGAIAVFE